MSYHGAAVVERKLGTERGNVHRPAPEIRVRFPRQPEHESRANGVPGVREPHEDATELNRPARVFEPAAEQDPGGDSQRNHSDRKHEQHRDQNQLRRDRRATPDLEIEAERDCVRGKQQRDRQHRGRPVRGQQDARDAGDGEEESKGGECRCSISESQTATPPGPLLLDHALGIGIER